MCAIAGILTHRDSKSNLEAMLVAMRHRGPDDSGTWIENGCHLGHNRLSIIDLSPAGHQPMVSASGRYMIVYNGEVYNFLSLRKELEQLGVAFRSHTDTEVILALWEREQAACVSRLRGMFAFGIWDIHERSITLVRDRLGIKPLYYAETAQGFVFASEIKGMLVSGLVERKINPRAIALFLQKGYVQQPYTILESVTALLPGHILQLKGGKTRIDSYWQLENQAVQFKSEEEAIHGVRQMVIEAVNEEMVSDRPVGVFLSGGLDSTVLVAALRAAGQNHIKTFTVGFDSTDNHRSEAKDAQVSANYYGTTHHDIQIESENVWKLLDDFIEAIDQPSVDGLNVWLVSQKTAEHVTVALSGLGGDELFSGYSIDRTMLYWRENRPALLKAIELTKPIWKNISSRHKLRRALEARNRLNDFTDAYLSWGEVNSEKNAAMLAGFSYQFQHKTVYDTFNSIDHLNAKDLLQRITAMHLHTFMSGRVLTISDACAMAHSLEVRFPLIDHRLVESAFNLPQAWKVKHIRKAARLKNYEAGNRFEDTGIKYILYQGFKHELPAGFGDRSKKGFQLPINQWMKNGLKEDLRSIIFSSDSFLPQKEIQELFYRWEKGVISWGPIWIVFVLEKWIKRYLGS